eukprot:UN29635
MSEIYKMTIGDVIDYIRTDRYCHIYIQRFIDNRVSGKTFVLLNEEKLKTIFQIDNKIHRDCILHLVDNLQVKDIKTEKGTSDGGGLEDEKTLDPEKNIELLLSNKEYSTFWTLKEDKVVEIHSNMVIYPDGSNKGLVVGTSNQNDDEGLMLSEDEHLINKLNNPVSINNDSKYIDIYLMLGDNAKYPGKIARDGTKIIWDNDIWTRFPNEKVLRIDGFNHDLLNGTYLQSGKLINSKSSWNNNSNHTVLRWNEKNKHWMLDIRKGTFNDD